MNFRVHEQAMCRYFFNRGHDAKRIDSPNLLGNGLGIFIERKQPYRRIGLQLTSACVPANLLTQII